MNYVSNCPDNFSEKAFDAYWGRPQSDAAADEHERQAKIQSAIAALRALLDTDEHMQTRIDYEALDAELENATIPEGKLADMISDADEQAFQDAKQGAAEYRAEMQRDWS